MGKKEQVPALRSLIGWFLRRALFFGGSVFWDTRLDFPWDLPVGLGFCGVNTSPASSYEPMSSF